MLSNPHKKWLILSHAFNMDGRASSLTVTDKLPYLVDAGFQPIILSAVTGKKDEKYPHFQLLPWGPSALRFDIRHWLMVRFGKPRWYKLAMLSFSIFLFPFIVLERSIIGLSNQWSWTYPAVLKGIQLIRRGDIDLIYSSGGAWSAHYAAWFIQQATGVKWIAEIHDPMVMNNESKKGSLFTKKTRERRFLIHLERKISHHADVVWWFTQNAFAAALQRNPILKNKGFFIYPGAEPPGCHMPLPCQHLYKYKLSICHFGSLSSTRSLVPVLDALNCFFKMIPEAIHDIELHIYGAPLDHESKNTLERLGMGAVMVYHGRLETREEVMQQIRLADVLLMLHGDVENCAEYIPSKLYDYYWSNRPIFAITHINHELDELLTQRQAYLSHTGHQASIIQALTQIWQDWQSKQLRAVAFRPIHVKDAVAQIINQINRVISS